MSERRKSYRERYFEDYKAVKTVAYNRKGYKVEYRYVGRWTQWSTERWRLPRIKLGFVVAEIVSVAIYIAAILSGTPFTHSRLANGFGALSLVPWLLELSGVVRFLAAGQFVKERTEHEIDQSIREGCVLRAILVGLSVAVGAVDLTGRRAWTGWDALVILAVVVSGALSLLVWRVFDTLLVIPYRNEEGRPGARE